MTPEIEALVVALQDAATARAATRAVLDDLFEQRSLAEAKDLLAYEAMRRAERALLVALNVIADVIAEGDHS